MASCPGTSKPCSGWASERVTAALGPIAVSRYGVHDGALWRPWALVALAIWVIFVVAFIRTAASRTINRSP